MAATAEQPEPTFEIPLRELSKTPRGLSRRQLNRRTRVDRITEALRDAKRADLTPVIPKNRVDLSHVNVRSYAGRKEHTINAKRHGKDFVPALSHTREVTLDKILASFIRHRTDVPAVGQAVWESKYQLPSEEISLLRSSGYDVDDVEAWAELILSADSYTTAVNLAQRVTSRGPHAVPLSVLLHILRRRYISARALRILMAQAWMLLDYRRSTTKLQLVSDDSVFLIFLRLVRHAREIWPRALDILPELLLQHLPSAHPSSPIPITQLETLSYMLNKAMRLIAVPTAVEPFKNNLFQEAGIVRILRFHGRARSTSSSQSRRLPRRDTGATSTAQNAEGT